MKKRLISAIIAATLVVGAGLVAAPAAHASSNGMCQPWQCGSVTNSAKSVSKVTVKRTGGTASIPIGSKSPSGFDWDYIWVAPGRCVRYGEWLGGVTWSACATPKQAGFWKGISQGTGYAYVTYSY